MDDVELEVPVLMDVVEELEDVVDVEDVEV